MFVDRADAGRRLASRLAGSVPADPVVVGMARGGMVVAAAVARGLGATLDVIVVRKIGYPWQPELAVGAIAEGGLVVLDHALIAELGLGRGDLARVIRRERQSLRDRVQRYRLGRTPVPVDGRATILVDDGLATGSTARVAIASLRRRGASGIVVAVPVSPADTVAAIRTEVDAVVVLETPAEFYAIGQFYEDFNATTDEEVVRLLASGGRC